MWYDIWSFSYKQQILNFWSRSEMVRKLRFQTGLSENCVFGHPGEPVFSKILKNYFFMISFISFNDIITFLKHLGKLTFLRLYLPLNGSAPSCTNWKNKISSFEAYMGRKPQRSHLTLFPPTIQEPSRPSRTKALSNDNDNRLGRRWPNPPWSWTVLEEEKQKKKKGKKNANVTDFSIEIPSDLVSKSI